MEYDFFAEDGSKVTVGPIPAEGLDSGDKATNKALSAALKYALIQTFSVPTEDMAEADLETPEIGVESGKDAKMSSGAEDVARLTERLATETKVVRRGSFARKTTTIPETTAVTDITPVDGWES
jgi:hypothetical protein